MAEAGNVRFQRRALLVYEAGEEFWIEWMFSARLVAPPFSVIVEATDNRRFDPENLKGMDLVILANLVMPRPDGFEVLERVYRVRPEVPVIVSSAMTRERFESRFDLPMEVTYLEKPFPFDRLEDAILKLLFLQPARRAGTVASIVPVTAASIRVIQYLSAHDEELYRVPDRFFEELLAELLDKQGWEVQLTPMGADGGIDIVAVRNKSDLPDMMLVQAKRYKEDRRVGVSVVRELLHVVDDKRATRGMIATTSAFTKGAKEEHLSYKWRLVLNDHDQIVAWLKDYAERRSPSPA